MSEGTEAQEQADAASLDDTGEDTKESIAEFLGQFPGGGCQYILTRLEPKNAFQGGRQRKASGHLETFHTKPTLDEIRESWAGGVYEMRVMGPVKGKPGLRYLGSRRFEIAGDPRLKAEVLADEVTTRSDQGLLKNVLDQSQEDKRRAEERLERERTRLHEEKRQQEQRPTTDPEMWKTTLETIERTAQARIETLNQQLLRRDQDLAEMRRQVDAIQSQRSPLGDPELLKVMFGRNHDEAGRQADAHRNQAQIERERHERELQAERDRLSRELQNERDRHVREVDAARRDHDKLADALEAERDRHARELDAERREREKTIDVVERLHKSEMDNLRTAHGQLIATKDEQVTRLNEELRSLNAEVRSLRASVRPQDTLSDLERMSKVVTAVKTFVPGLGGGESVSEPPAWWEKLAEHARPFVERMIDKDSRPSSLTAQTSAPVLQMLPRQSFVQVPRLRSVPMVQSNPAAPPSQPVPQVAQPAPAEAVSNSSRAPEAPSELMQGLGYLEQAMRNGISPEVVARSAHTSFERAVLEQLVAMGHETVSEQIATLAPTSPLLTVGGRRFLSEFVDALAAGLKGA